MSTHGAPGRVEVRGLTWRPASRRRPVLRDLELTLEPGERVLLAGPSGAGKSTLLRAIAGVLEAADVGDLTGSVRIDGSAPHDEPGRVVLLLQDPTASVVAERVGRDVAFGPENIGLAPEAIWRRVHAALEAVRFPYGVDHFTSALSGGESQRLALAGALALEPTVMLLDEPTSMLDPEMAAEVRAAILDVVRRRDSTLVVAEHRLDPWIEHVDRLVVLDADGAVIADGEPGRVLDEREDSLAEMGIWVPGLASPEPFDVSPSIAQPWESGLHAGWPAITADGVFVRHRARLGARRRDPDVLALDGVSARLVAGDVLAITGISGAGKSTLVSVLAGLRQPDAGAVIAAERLATAKSGAPWRWRSRQLATRVAWLPQQPEHGVVAKTVADETRAAGRTIGRDELQLDRRGDALLEALGISHLAGESPYRISGGEQRRLMLAAALAHGPSALLLDEPTVGQDRRTWAAVAGACVAAREGGTALGVSTHDRSTVTALADRIIRLDRGREVDTPSTDARERHDHA